MFFKKNSKGNIVKMIPGTPATEVTEDGLQASLGENGVDNYLINGGFDFWQRGNTTTASSGSGAYLADRWWMYGNAAGDTQVRVGSGTPGDYWLRMTGANTSTQLYLGQSLETFNILPLRGKSVTLSMSIKRNSTNTVDAVLWLRTQTGTENRFINQAGAVTTQVTIPNGSISTSGWTRFSMTLVVPAAATQIGGGVRPSAEGVYFPTGAQLDVKDVMLNLGTRAAPFKRAGGDIQGELAKCQRYYYRPTDSDVTGADAVAVGQCWNTTQAGVIIPFPVAMRAVPVPNSSGMALTGASSSVLPVTGLADWNSTKYTGSLNITVASGLVAGNATLLQRNGTNVGYYVDFSAEL